LSIGVAASVAANILHAQPNPISQTIAAWPPLALLLTVELVSRVPVHRPLLAVVRVLATIVISGIAAWVSYWHMKGVAAHYGETDASPYLLPISVDGLIVVASICLVELAARIRHLEEPPTPSPSTVAAPTVVQDEARTVPGAVPTDGVEVDEDQVLDDELVARAHQAAAEFRRRTGRDITRDQLRAMLRTSNTTAGQLLQLTRTTPAGNGTTPHVEPARPTSAIATLGGPTR
jgi:hypothetical protein